MAAEAMGRRFGITYYGEVTLGERMGNDNRLHGGIVAKNSQRDKAAVLLSRHEKTSDLAFGRLDSLVDVL